jgi:hypothetical protein
MSDLLHAVIKSLADATDKGEIPANWEATNPADRDIGDGYIFLRRDRIIIGCIIDVAIHKRDATAGKGPLTLEKYYSKYGWKVLCDADTPEQVVAAFVTYSLFGEFNDL